LNLIPMAVVWISTFAFRWLRIDSGGGASGRHIDHGTGNPMVWVGCRASCPRFQSGDRSPLKRVESDGLVVA